MIQRDIDRLKDQLNRGQITRREFSRAAMASGMSGAAAIVLARNVSAFQAASPEATPDASGTTSMTREEFDASVRETYPLEEPAVSGGTVILADTTEMRTFNPQVATDVAALGMLGLVYQALASASPVDGLPAPELADKWTVGADGVTYTFYIHPNAAWHDGNPVTADDVVFSFDAILDEQSKSTRTARVGPALKSYRKVDDKTVELVGMEPSATFVEDTAVQVRILPKHIWKDIPIDQWGSDPGSTGQDPSLVVGSGPFRFIEWVVNDHVTLERNEEYWEREKVPVINQIIRQVVPEESSKIAALKTGGADIISVSSSQVDGLKSSDPELLVTNYPTLTFLHYYCNQVEEKSPYFHDVRVRQAMMYAIDRDLIADTIYQGYATKAVGTQPELSVAYRPDEVNHPYEFDPDKAASLLDEAGWTVGSDGVREKDGIRFSFETMYNEGSENYANMVPYLQQAWRDVGLELNAAAKPFPTIVDQAIAGDFDMVLGSFTWNVSGDQSVMFGCESGPPQGYNRMGYCNSRYDELNELQRRELDLEKRIDILVEQSNIVNDEVATSVVLFTDAIYASTPALHNFAPNGYETYWSIPYVWIEQ